jgi:hypothetical protein
MYGQGGCHEVSQGLSGRRCHVRDGTLFEAELTLLFQSRGRSMRLTSFVALRHAGWVPRVIDRTISGAKKAKGSTVLT